MFVSCPVSVLSVSDSHQTESVAAKGPRQLCLSAHLILNAGEIFVPISDMGINVADFLIDNWVRNESWSWVRQHSVLMRS